MASSARAVLKPGGRAVFADRLSPRPVAPGGRCAAVGAYIYCSEWKFLGGPVKDITLENFRVGGVATAGLCFSGPAENIRGNVTVVGTPLDCLADQGTWSGTSLTQIGGAVLLLNGSELEASKLKTSWSHSAARSRICCRTLLPAASTTEKVTEAFE